MVLTRGRGEVERTRDKMFPLEAGAFKSYLRRAPNTERSTPTGQPAGELLSSNSSFSGEIGKIFPK